jgi:hypothetical protein
LGLLRSSSYFSLFCKGRKLGAYPLQDLIPFGWRSEFLPPCFSYLESMDLWFPVHIWEQKLKLTKVAIKLGLKIQSTLEYRSIGASEETGRNTRHD